MARTKVFSRCLLQTANLFFLIFGGIILGFSITYLAKRNSAIPAYVISIVGSSILIVLSLIGCCGAAYSSEDHSKRLSCLVIYSLVSFSLMGAFLAIGMMGSIFPDIRRLWMAELNYDPAKAKALSTAIESEKINFIAETAQKPAILAILLYGFAAVFLIVSLLSGSIMGGKNYMKTLLSLGSVTEIVLGAITFVVGIYLFSRYRIAHTGTTKTLAIILTIAGSVIIILGVMSLLSSIRVDKSVFLRILALITAFLICAGAVAGGVMALVSSAQLNTPEQREKIKQWMQRMCVTNSPSVKGVCQRMADRRVVTSVVDALLTNMKIVGFSMLFYASFMLLMFVLLCASFCCNWQRSDEEYSYRQRKARKRDIAAVLSPYSYDE